MLKRDLFEGRKKFIHVEIKHLLITCALMVKENGSSKKKIASNRVGTNDVLPSCTNETREREKKISRAIFPGNLLICKEH